MKVLFAFFIFPLLFHGNNWVNNFEIAKEKAQKEHKLIILNFSGSDWCIPCIRMHKEILESDQFRQYADSNLIMVNADFPRMQKNKLPKSQQKANDALADKYNAEGNFPLTLLLDSNGKVIYTWNGFYSKSPESFTDEVKQLVINNFNR